MDPYRYFQLSWLSREVRHPKGRISPAVPAVDVLFDDRRWRKRHMFLSNTGISDMYRIRVHAGISCWEPHTQLVLTDTSIQPNVILITLSVTLPLTTGTMYIY